MDSANACPVLEYVEERGGPGPRLSVSVWADGQWVARLGFERAMGIVRNGLVYWCEGISTRIPAKGIERALVAAGVLVA